LAFSAGALSGNRGPAGQRGAGPAIDRLERRRGSLRGAAGGFSRGGARGAVRPGDGDAAVFSAGDGGGVGGGSARPLPVRAPRGGGGVRRGGGAGAGGGRGGCGEVG